MCSDAGAVISVDGISKFFEIYPKPSYRLWQMIFRGRRRFYEPFWALRDISFTVGRGECVGVIGRNGAGKSTLLQIITGTLAASSGCIDVKGRVAALLELGSGFNPEFTGRENVYLNASILGLTREETDSLRRHRGLCGHRRLHRPAGQKLLQRHGGASGLCRGGPCGR